MVNVRQLRWIGWRETRERAWAWLAVWLTPRLGVKARTPTHGAELISAAVLGLGWPSLILTAGDIFALAPLAYAPLAALAPSGSDPEVFWALVFGGVGLIQSAGLRVCAPRWLRLAGGILATATLAGIAAMFFQGNPEGLLWRLHAIICLTQLWTLWRL